MRFRRFWQLFLNFFFNMQSSIADVWQGVGFLASASSQAVYASAISVRSTVKSWPSGRLIHRRWHSSAWLLARWSTKFIKTGHSSGRNDKTQRKASSNGVRTAILSAAILLPSGMVWGSCQRLDPSPEFRQPQCKIIVAWCTPRAWRIPWHWKITYIKIKIFGQNWKTKT